MTDDERWEFLEQMLRGIQTKVSAVSRDMHEVKDRVTSMEISIGHLNTGIGHVQVQMGQLNQRLDRIDERVERIETRLDLVEAPSPAAE